jgi:hypothetical protein
MNKGQATGFNSCQRVDCSGKGPEGVRDKIESTSVRGCVVRDPDIRRSLHWVIDDV